MAITWIPPLDTPTTVVPSVSAGGSLDASTTYYIRITAATIDNYRKTNPPMLRSNPSIEVNIATDAVNKTIDLTWDAVAGAGVYNIYITDDAVGDDRWRALSRFYQASATNSASITDIASGRNYIVDTFAIPASATSPANLAKDIGEGYVNITGILGAIDFDDIAGVVPAAHLSWDGSHFIIKGSVYINSATGTMSETYKRITTWHGWWNIHTNSKTTFLTTFYSSIFDNFHWSFRLETLGMTLYDCLIIKCLHYSSYSRLYGGDTYVTLNQYFTDGGGNTINGLNAQVYDDTTLEDLIVINAGILFQGEVNLNLLRCTSERYVGLYHNAVDFSTFNVRECILNKSSGYDLRFAYSWTAGTYPFYDCTFPRRADNVPIVGYTTAGAYANTVELFNSFTIRVQAKDGTAIENATVTLKNKNDVQQFSVLTDVLGDIVKQDVSRLFITHTAGGGTYDNDVEEYSPFTITIKKVGYLVYENIFNLSEKIEWIISLERITVNVDQESL